MIEAKVSQHNSLMYKARFQFIWSLALLVLACGEQKKKQENEHKLVTIHWEDKQATSIVLPQNELPGYSADSLSAWLDVSLGYSTESILGESSVQGDSVEFIPLVPFTRGFEYTVRWKKRFVEQFRIPVDTTLEQPDVVEIYPSADTLPANLLKMYIKFSKPMREGQAKDYMYVLKNKKEIPSTFLNMDPELWNKDRTILTVWLDPGRIKRDLQPNQKLGPPLEKGNRYNIHVNQGWEDEDGLLLRAGFHLDFIADDRDEQSPDPAKWTIHSSIARTTLPLMIEFHESLDYYVLINSIRLLDFMGKPVKAKMEVMPGETMIGFMPMTPWASGYYTLEVHPRLEDVAGNNLERVFDKDLLTDTATKRTGIYKRTFRIQ